MFIIANKYGQRVLVPDDADTQWLVPASQKDLPEDERDCYKEVYLASILTFEDCERMYIQVTKLDMPKVVF